LNGLQALALVSICQVGAVTADVVNAFGEACRGDHDAVPFVVAVNDDEVGSGTINGVVHGNGQVQGALHLCARCACLEWLHLVGKVNVARESLTNSRALY
jgi:hypothetical protein